MAVAVEEKSGELRQKTVDLARRHKASWIELGRHLYAIHRDKHYKAWGYLSFEAYCVRELAIKQQTAAKLLKSYYFLEREEPRYVEARYAEEEAPKKIPDYESVNLLRLARENKNITPRDFAQIRESVLGSARDPKEVRNQVKKILGENVSEDTEQAKIARRNAAIKRIITLLNHTKSDCAKEKLLPGYLLKQMDDLAQKLKDQLD